PNLALPLHDALPILQRIPAWNLVRFCHVTDKIGEHLLHRSTVGIDALQKLDELFVVLPGKRADRVDSGEKFVCFVLVHIEDENRHFLHAGQLLDAKVSVDEHEPASIARIVGENGICNPHFGKQALECIALVLGMRAPVLRIRAKLRRWNAAKLYDSVSDLHGRAPQMLSKSTRISTRPPLQCSGSGFAPGWPMKFAPPCMWRFCRLTA